MRLKLHSPIKECHHQLNLYFQFFVFYCQVMKYSPTLDSNSPPQMVEILPILLQHIFWNDQCFCCNFDILLRLERTSSSHGISSWTIPYWCLISIIPSFFMKRLMSHILISRIVLNSFRIFDQQFCYTWFTNQTWNQQLKIFLFSFNFSWGFLEITMGKMGLLSLFLLRRSQFVVRRSVCLKSLEIFPKARGRSFIVFASFYANFPRCKIDNL